MWATRTATVPPSAQKGSAPSPSVAGATTPFTTYQAPEASLGGGASVVSLTSPPTSQYDSPQGEASGHAYVQLAGTGQYVQWTNDTGQPVSFINVRAAIPDSPAGGGITATLDLYVNGTFRQALLHRDMGRRLQPEQRLPYRHLGKQPDRGQQLHPRHRRRRHGDQLRRLQRQPDLHPDDGHHHDS
jgi:hypothetical protein